MKNLFFNSFLLLLLYSANISAKDWKNLNPKMNNVLVETTILIAAEISIVSRQKSEIHTHHAYFFDVLTDGKLIVRYTDRKKEIFDLKEGDSGFSIAKWRHFTENVATNANKPPLVELK